MKNTRYLTRFIYLVLFILFISCEKKTGDYKVIESTVIIDSISNFVYGTKIYFRLEAIGGIEPYSCDWISPDSLEGLGPHEITTSENVNINVIILDNYNSIKDTIITTIDTYEMLQNTDRYNFDYRDIFIGNYFCNLEYHKWCFEVYDSVFHDTVTITVEKAEKQNEITLLGETSGVDSINQRISFADCGYYGYWMIVIFYPNDSITIDKSTCPLGCGNTWYYRGEK